ncbi:MAG TPA: crosslink repair DNA glycosylase YcaQ family protein [Trueperaceae bacterium]
MTEKLTAAEARRVFLHAQGLARRRPGGAVGQRRFREYLLRQGVLQLDSVNVLARAHYLPLYSRFGPYDRQALDAYLWSSGETFEHWGHEASVMPRELLPSLRFRMADLAERWAKYFRRRPERYRPELFDEVERAVHELGPVTAKDLEHLEEERGGPRRQGWWDWSLTKEALEYLFFTGRAAVAGRPNFQRLYDSPARAWGEHACLPARPTREAQQRLFDIALSANWIGTVADIGDHFRIKVTQAKPLAESAVERGLARWVRVEGWREKALLYAGAEDPGRATGAALLSPFDPACWYRDRLLRQFGMDYRIEIYTPAHKRVYGYYTLPFLLGDQMVARVDLKAERRARELRVLAAWSEEAPAPGARRRRDTEVAAALARELRLMAEWLGLSSVVVEPKGTLAAALAREVAAGAEA